MFKISLLAALAGILLFIGCPAPKETSINVGVMNGNLAVPDTSYNLLSAFTDALPCNGVALNWSIREQSIGWVIATDGSITQGGVWTSPACGSVWLGQQMHIDAKCVASGQTATAVVATVPEQVSGVQIAYAVRTNVGQAACLFPSTPDGRNFVAQNQLCPGATDACVNPNGCYCVQGGATVNFYARVITTCGEVVTPTPPATWPAVCP